LEARAWGVPGAASHTSSLPEVIGKAGILVDPYEVDNIAHGIYRGLTDVDLRNKLIQCGFKPAQKFSWKRTAYKTVAQYEEAFKI